jgi:putative membrane protein
MRFLQSLTCTVYRKNTTGDRTSALRSLLAFLDSPPTAFIVSHLPNMFKLLLNWVLNAIAFLITQRIIDQILPNQFQLKSIAAAAIAALILGLINATVRPVLKILTFPLTILTLGLSSFAINVGCLMFVAWFVPGFELRGIVPAALGSIVLSIVSTLLNWVFNNNND